MNGGGGGGGLGWRPPFTAAQWQELEHQALIFKYMMAGVPVPQELLIPIRRSFEAMSSRYYHHPSLGFCYYGKKLDPEPGRCRRTDGKKWRCSKDAYPDSKYCERHMHRGRNRSRKPVETHSLPQSQSSSSTVTTTTTTTAAAAVHAGPSSSQLHTGFSSYPMHNKDFRYLQGVKPAMDEHSLFSEPSASARGIAIDSSLESSWGLMPSNVSSFPLSKATSDVPGSLLHCNYGHRLQGMQDIGQPSMSSMQEPQQQQQHAFFGTEFGSSETVKHESHQSLRPFFDEWPKTRESWSNLDADRCNRNSYSTTQLSISIPMASSDFSMTTSRSPNGD